MAESVMPVGVHGQPVIPPDFQHIAEIELGSQTIAQSIVAIDQ